MGAQKKKKLKLNFPKIVIMTFKRQMKICSVKQISAH